MLKNIILPVLVVAIILTVYLILCNGVSAQNFTALLATVGGAVILPSLLNKAKFGGDNIKLDIDNPPNLIWTGPNGFTQNCTPTDCMEGNPIVLPKGTNFSVIDPVSNQQVYDVGALDNVSVQGENRLRNQRSGRAGLICSKNPQTVQELRSRCVNKSKPDETEVSKIQLSESPEEIFNSAQKLKAEDFAKLDNAKKSSVQEKIVNSFMSIFSLTGVSAKLNKEEERHKEEFENSPVLKQAMKKIDDAATDGVLSSNEKQSQYGTVIDEMLRSFGVVQGGVWPFTNIANFVKGTTNAIGNSCRNSVKMGRTIAALNSIDTLPLEGMSPEDKASLKFELKKQIASGILAGAGGYITGVCPFVFVKNLVGRYYNSFKYHMEKHYFGFGSSDKVSTFNKIVSELKRSNPANIPMVDEHVELITGDQGGSIVAVPLVFVGDLLKVMMTLGAYGDLEFLGFSKNNKTVAKMQKHVDMCFYYKIFDDLKENPQAEFAVELEDYFNGDVKGNPLPFLATQPPDVTLLTGNEVESKYSGYTINYQARVFLDHKTLSETFPEFVGETKLNVCYTTSCVNTGRPPAASLGEIKCILVITNTTEHEYTSLKSSGIINAIQEQLSDPSLEFWRLVPVSKTDKKIKIKISIGKNKIANFMADINETDNIEIYPISELDIDISAPKELIGEEITATDPFDFASVNPKPSAHSLEALMGTSSVQATPGDVFTMPMETPQVATSLGTTTQASSSTDFMDIFGESTANVIPAAKETPQVATSLGTTTQASSSTDFMDIFGEKTVTPVSQATPQVAASLGQKADTSNMSLDELMGGPKVEIIPAARATPQLAASLGQKADTSSMSMDDLFGTTTVSPATRATPQLAQPLSSSYGEAGISTGKQLYGSTTEDPFAGIGAQATPTYSSPGQATYSSPYAEPGIAVTEQLYGSDTYGSTSQAQVAQAQVAQARNLAFNAPKQKPKPKELFSDIDVGLGNHYYF